MIDQEVAYQSALDYIYSFVDYSLTRNLRYSAEKFDLSRMPGFFEPDWESSPRISGHPCSRDKGEGINIGIDGQRLAIGWLENRFLHISPPGRFCRTDSA